MIGLVLSLALVQGTPEAAVEVFLPDPVVAAGPAGEAPSPADVAAAKKPTTWSAAFFASAKVKMDAEMLDYPSARFRSIRAGVRDSRRVLCGAVNGKNRMGAYVGWTNLLIVETDSGLHVEMEAVPTYKIRHFCLGPTAWSDTDVSARLAP